MGPIYSLDDIFDMLRRRALLILGVIALGCVVSVFWALSHQHLYRSAEVIQIEQPRIANDLAPSTVEGSSARRLQLIEQQLQARSTLIQIIDKLDLYANAPALRPAEKVQLLREAVSITGVAAAREGFADDGTISVLTITAEMDSAEKAQAVAHEFAERTRALSAAQRRDQTRDTLEFFTRQEQNLLRDLRALETELQEFRSEHDLSMAGGVAFRRDEIASLNEAVLALEREIIAAELGRERIDKKARAPTIARLKAEFDGQIDSLTTQRNLLQARLAKLSTSLETSPEVERALAEFERRRDQMQDQLEVIAARRSEAEVGHSLETAARGERLITLEEAPLPDEPVSMSRKKRALIGAMASVVLALLAALALEIRRPIIRSAAQMQRETGLIPVVSIPEMDLPRPKRGFARLWQRR